jgi:hypothetical protein
MKAEQTRKIWIDYGGPLAIERGRWATIGACEHDRGRRGKSGWGEDGDCNKKEDEGTKGGNRARRSCAGYGNSHADPLEIAD